MEEQKKKSKDAGTGAGAGVFPHEGRRPTNFGSTCRPGGGEETIAPTTSSTSNPGCPSVGPGSEPLLSPQQVPAIKGTSLAAATKTAAAKMTQEEPGVEAQVVNFRALRDILPSDDNGEKEEEDDGDDVDVEGITSSPADVDAHTTPGAISISPSGNKRGDADEEESSVPQVDEDPEFREIEAHLVEEKEIVHGEVVHHSRHKLGALLALLLVGIVVVILLATLLNRGNDEEPIVLVTSTVVGSSPAPTQYPSNQPTQSTFGRVFDLFLPISGDKLMNTSSPQYQAFSWLVFDDSSFVAHDEGVPDWVLVERYIVALLYYEWFMPDDTSNIASDYQFTSNASICDWRRGTVQGIQCHTTGRDTGRVSNVNLIGDIHPIRGTLPSELSSLESVEYLYLPSHEFLTGTIPPELGTLEQLVSLVITDCSLSGTIPGTIRDLSKLNWFDLRSNFLNGTIPELSKVLDVFEVFVVTDNKLTGPIPDFRQNNLFRLKVIALNNNGFTGTISSSFWTLQSLEELFLSDNSIEGRLPSDLSSSSVLKSLLVSNNELTGSIPDIFPNSLEGLRLDNNLFDGSIPTEIGNLSELKRLTLNSNNLIGPLPSEMGRLVNVQDLVLSENSLTGTIPTEIGRLVNAGTVNFRGNRLTGIVPSSLSNLGILNREGPCRVELHGTDLSGDLDPVFCRTLNSSATTVISSQQEVFAACLGDSPPINCSCCFACCDAVGSCFCNSDVCRG